MRTRRLFGVIVGMVSLLGAARAEPAPPIPDPNAQPSLASGLDGSVHAVWAEGPLGSQVIQYSLWNGSVWSEPEGVVSDTSVSGLKVLVRSEDVVCVYWTVIGLLETCRVSGVWTEPVEIAREAASTEFRPAYTPSGELRLLHVEPPTGVYYGDIQLNPGDEVVTFPRFVVDSDGGLHAFWFDFSPDRGWVWSFSSDDGSTWTTPESLSTTLPQASGTLVGIDGSSGVHSVLVSGFELESRHWTPESGWSEVEVVDFTPGAIGGDLAVGQSGALTVVTATGGGALEFVRPPGGSWSEAEVIPGTEGLNIDAVLAASEGNGRVMVLWHELGAVGFNQTALGEESLVSSIPSPLEISLDPIVVAASAALTAGVIFLVPFPAEIFNNTLADHYDEIRGWFRRRPRAEPRTGFWDRPLGLVLFLLGCSLLYGFLDPGFGANTASLVLFVGLFAGVVLTTVGFAIPTILARHSRDGEWGRPRPLPLALVVGIGCVVISRAVGFVPGYLYAVVIGLVFLHEATKREEAREVMVSSIVLLALALGSWVGLGVVRSDMADGWAFEISEAALAMTVTSAFEALAIGLLPIRGMPGSVLFAERKRVWLIVWGVSVFAFFHFIIDPSNGYLAESSLVPVVTTVSLLVVFSVLSLGLWGFFNLRTRRRARPERA